MNIYQNIHIKAANANSRLTLVISQNVFLNNQDRFINFSNFANNSITLISDNSIYIDSSYNYLFNFFLQIDSVLDINSRGLLPNSVITAALQALTPDSSLDADSNKPVMNSAVTQEINTITQIIENFQDINVSTLQEFENAIQTGQNANVRIHLTTDITLTQSVSYNLDKIEIYGHDNKINLENFTFTIIGSTCLLNQIRFNANSSVSASSATNYSNAKIIIKATEASTRYFFEHVIFMNFVCQNSDGNHTFIDISANSNLSTPSAHIYLLFCEVMTKYMSSNINNCVALIYHSGGENGQQKFHALTCHNIDFFGNNIESNSCANWSFYGQNLTGLAKLGWITDGSAIYKNVPSGLTPSFVNQYNPSYNEFTSLQNIVNNLVTKYSFNNTTSNADTTLTIYVINKLAFCLITCNITASITNGATLLTITDLNFKNNGYKYFNLKSFNGTSYFDLEIYFNAGTNIIGRAGSFSTLQNFSGNFILELE